MKKKIKLYNRFFINLMINLIKYHYIMIYRNEWIIPYKTKSLFKKYFKRQKDKIKGIFRKFI